MTPASTQERAIAAGDQSEAILYEVDGDVAKGGGLPGCFGYASGSENSFRDFAIGGAFCVPVHGLKHTTKPMALLRGKTGVWWDALPVNRAPKAHDRVNPIETIGAERKDRNGRHFGRSVGCQQKPNRCRTVSIENTLAVRPRMCVAGNEVGKNCALNHRKSRNRSEDDGPGICFRCPEYRGVSGAQRWGDRESAPPSAGAS